MSNSELPTMHSWYNNWVNIYIKDRENRLNKLKHIINTI